MPCQTDGDRDRHGMGRHGRVAGLNASILKRVILVRRVIDSYHPLECDGVAFVLHRQTHLVDGEVVRTIAQSAGRYRNLREAQAAAKRLNARAGNAYR